MILDRQGSHLEAVIDVVNMIDVVFMLLIFFLVASTIKQQERETQVALPQTVSAGPISARLREIVINIDASGKIIVNGQTVDAAGLGSIVREAVKNNPEQRVSIRGDRTTAYENVARVLDVCKSAGIQEPFLESVASR